MDKRHHLVLNDEVGLRVNLGLEVVESDITLSSKNQTITSSNRRGFFA